MLDSKAESHALSLLASSASERRVAPPVLPPQPVRKVAVVTCMDARLEPLSALGAQLGDLHVIRNAGGRVTDDVIRSLVISQQLLGTEEILVIHHTECGMMTFDNETLRTRIADALGPKAEHASRQIDFLPFSDLAESVREDIRKLRQSPLIPEHIRIYGGIYDVHTGKIEQVE